MKAKTILIVLICIIFTAAFCQAAEKSATSGPKAIFPEKLFEFPTVIEGVEVQHDFVVQNSGSETLKILDIQTG